MGFGAENVHRDSERIAELLHDPKALLVVGPAATDVDFGIVLLQLDLVLLQGSDNALEGGGNIGKVGDSTPNNQLFAIFVRVPSH